MNASQPQRPTRGHGFFLLTTKPKRPTLLATNGSSLLRKPLQTSVEERKGVINLIEVIAPTLEHFSDFDGAHRLARILVEYRQYEFCPRYFCLHLLAQSPLESDLCGLQLHDLRMQLVALASFYFDQPLNLLKRVLESLSHSGSHYKHIEVELQAVLKSY